MDGGPQTRPTSLDALRPAGVSGQSKTQSTSSLCWIVCSLPLATLKREKRYVTFQKPGNAVTITARQGAPGADRKDQILQS